MNNNKSLSMKKVILLLLLSISFSQIANAQQMVTFVLNQAPCNSSGPDGIITATASSLTPPINFTWFVNGTTIVQNNVASTSTTLNTYSGSYVYVVATDGVGQSTGTYFGAPPFSISTTSQAFATCTTPGIVTTTVTGGTPPFTYVYWDYFTNTTVSTLNPASLMAGEYGVTVTDANGCTYGTEFKPSDTISVYSANSFVPNITTVPASCTNGSVTINSVSGGTAPYTYVWSNASTASSITGLLAGNYWVEITDATNCTETHYFNVSQTPYIVVQTTSANATCTNNDGSSTAFGTGGTPPYTYLWNGTFTTQSISNLSPGSYTAVATDANGCTGQGYAYVGVSTPINVTYTSTTSSCTNPTGTATLSISGGQAPYTINWNTSPAQSTLTATNLAPGNHSFSVTDANGCVRTGTAVVAPVNQISVSGSPSSASCTMSNGSVNITAAGGTAPYTYLWSNTAATQNLSNVPTGQYSVQVTDAIGCTKNKNYYVPSSTPIGIALSTTPTSCIYASDGSIIASPSGGTAPYTWTQGAAVNNNLSVGWYYNTVVDANGCVGSSATYVANGNTSNACYCTITGTVYDDQNNNCIQDPTEQGIPNIQIHCSGFGYAYTDANGQYEFKVPSGTYTISETIQTQYPLSTCQNNSNSVTVVAVANCVQTVNFGNAINPLRDIKTNVWSHYKAVPGFPYKQKKIITNMGTIPESNILTGYENDGQLGVASFVPSQPIVFNANDWYENAVSPLSLNPGFSANFDINYTVPVNVPLSTVLEFRDSVSYSNLMSDWLNDYTPWDNVKLHQKVVVGSYDPNFKEVSPVGEGPEGDIFAEDSVLDYMVHFQNLGTWYAQDVVVIDTLDPDLDWTTMKPVYQSHPCTITISDVGVARFEFKNIQLPAKTQNEPASHGMFSYEIKTKKNLPLGTKFTNKAEIYFDFNPAIITNTTVNTLTAPASIEEYDKGFTQLDVYPNPAENVLHIEFAKSNELTRLDVYDVSGKLIQSQQVDGQLGQHEINIESLTTGVYLLSVQNSVISKTAKFIKK